MIKKRVLTGITTTGSPHLGNYAGAIKQAVDLSQLKNQDSFYFLADYHALVKNKDPKQIEKTVNLHLFPVYVIFIKSDFLFLLHKQQK